jgi:sialate O-acetylesterase
MVAPATCYGIKGIIWYQGEADAGRAELYGKMFPALISDWRTKWGLGDLPFLYVQLTGMELNHEFDKRNSSWSKFREVQREALRLPEMGMVVSVDLADPYDVHPKNKREFGRRLALQAMRVRYKNARYRRRADAPIGRTKCRYGRVRVLRRTGSHEEDPFERK